MRKLLAILLIAAVGGATALPAAVNTYTLTGTNFAVSGDSAKANGVTRIFTNATTATTILTNLGGAAHTITNVMSAYGGFPQATVGFSVNWLTSTQLTFIGNNLTFNIAGNWGYVTTNSSPSTNLHALMLPHYNLQGSNAEIERTNDGNHTAEYLRYVTTNALRETDVFGSNLVGRTRTEDVGNKRLTNSVVDGGRVTNVGGIHGTVFQLTHGRYVSPTNHTPVSFSGVNYSNAFSSPGQGTSSEQFGSGATATTNSATAVGRLATAQGIRSSAFGAAASAGADDTVALGSAANVDGLSPNGVAIGVNAEVSQATNGIAIGKDAFVLHTDSVAIGATAQSTDTNQVSLGAATGTVLISGRLTISGSQSNTTFTGTNQWKGDIATPAYSVSTLAAGNNIAVDFGTNYLVRLDAGSLTAAPTICGLVDGRDGLEYLVFNNTGYAVTFAINTVDPTPANRFAREGNANALVVNQGWALLKYEGSGSRYRIVAVWPEAATLRTDAALTNGSYTNTPNDRFVYIPSGSARTNRLFDATTSTNALITIKDAPGHAAGTNIIVVGLSGQTIDGAASYTMSGAYGAVTLQVYGTNWAIVSKY
jgi:hypothetical protein